MDPSPAVYNLFGGSDDMFFAKYSTSGNFMWAGSIDAGGFFDNIKIDNLNNVLLGGNFSGTVDFDPSGLNTFNMSSGVADCFLAKYGRNGNFKWAISLQGINLQSASYGAGLKIGESNTIYITGSYKGSVDFDPSVSSMVLTSTIGNDIFVAKYDSSGNFIWAKSFGGSGMYDYGVSMDMDGNENLYITGDFLGTMDMDPGLDTFDLNSSIDGQVFISCFNKYGDFQWARGLGLSSMARASRIRLDDKINIYIHGFFQGITSFDPGNNASKLTALGVRDIFLAKYDSTGNFIWANQIGKVNLHWAKGMEIDQSNNIYINGWFVSHWVDFNFGAGGNYMHSSYNSTYLAKYGQCTGSSQSNTQVSLCSGEEYTFPSGKRSSVSTIDTSVISSFSGCDSVIITDLSVYQVNAIVNFKGSKLEADEDSAIYQWIKCDSSGYSEITGETNQSISPTSNGDYAVIVANDGCTDTSECKSITWVGIDDFSSKGDLIIYPNPTKDILYIQSDLDEYDIHIFNPIGQMVIEEKIFEGQIDVSRLNEGVYIGRIETKKGNYAFRFVKE